MILVTVRSGLTLVKCKTSSGTDETVILRKSIFQFKCCNYVTLWHTVMITVLSVSMLKTFKCAIRTHDCHKKADCINTMGDYECYCRFGYVTVAMGKGFVSRF